MRSLMPRVAPCFLALPRVTTFKCDRRAAGPRRPRGPRAPDTGDSMDTAPPSPQSAFSFLGGVMQEPLPVPEGLTPRAIPEKGYIVEAIADDVFFVTEGTYCIMFIITSEGVVQVDTPPSFGGNIAAAVAEVTDEPVKFMIYSHSHLDHVNVAAAGFDAANVTFVGTPAVEAQLVGAGDPRRPVPTRIVPDGGTLTVGGVDIVLKSVKGAHDLGSTIVELPGRGVVMLVDLVAPGWAPFPCALAGSLFWCCWPPRCCLHARKALQRATPHLARRPSRRQLSAALGQAAQTTAPYRNARRVQVLRFHHQPAGAPRGARRGARP